MSININSATTGLSTGLSTGLTGTAGKNRELTREQVMKIMNKRRDGIYNVEETKDEAIYCVNQLKAIPSDKVVFLHMATGTFQVNDLREFMEQLQNWKRLKCKIRRCNIIEIDCEDEGKATMFIVQPEKTTFSTPMSPLAMAFGTMVSGYTYIALDKNLVEIAWRHLGSHK